MDVDGGCGPLCGINSCVCEAPEEIHGGLHTNQLSGAIGVHGSADTAIGFCNFKLASLWL